MPNALFETIDKDYLKKKKETTPRPVKNLPRKITRKCEARSDRTAFGELLAFGRHVPVPKAENKRAEIPMKKETPQ